MNYQLPIFSLVVAAIIFIIIKTARIYSIPVADFKSLLSGMNDSKLIDVTARGPHHASFKYQIYPIDIIPCFDKKGNSISLKNSPALEIQFTAMDNKKKSFYFDTIRMNGTIVKGSQSRFVTSIQGTIDLNTVTKIELRKIKKGFKYVGNPFNNS